MSRTVADWLERAKGGAGPADVDRCLDEAAALAEQCHEWRMILGALADLPSVAPARMAGFADRTLASAVAEAQVWGLRDVATVRAGPLGDAAGARRALDAGFDMLQGRETTRPHEWSLLAEGYAEILGDPAGGRRFLAAGADLARRRRDAPGLADVATALDRLDDRPSALALVAEAERLLGDDVYAAWSVANAWHGLAEFRAANRLLDATLQRARTTEEAVRVARAFHSHDNGPDVDRALARAADLASGAEDWYEVARAGHDTGRGAAAVRSALDRAAAGVAADDGVVRERIAAGYHRWLDDRAAADRLGARGVRPDALRPMRRSVPGWPASAAALFDWLRARLTDPMLERIAAADYGIDHEEHLAALRDMQATGLVPRELPWHPGEVVRLTRWASGERVDHVQRAWCCSLLCLSGDDPDDVLPALVESCLALGDAAPELGQGLVAWVCGTDPGPGDGGEAPPLALLALLLLCAARDPADPRIGDLVAAIRSAGGDRPDSLKTTLGASLLAALWNDLVARVLEPLRRTREDVDGLLDLIG